MVSCWLQHWTQLSFMDLSAGLSGLLLASVLDSVVSRGLECWTHGSLVGLSAGLSGQWSLVDFSAGLSSLSWT